MEECSATFSATLWEMPRASLCPKPLFPRRCSGTTRLQQAPRGAGGSPQPRSTSIPRIPGKPTASCSPRALRPSSGGAAALFPPPPRAHTRRCLSPGQQQPPPRPTRVSGSSAAAARGRRRAAASPRLAAPPGPAQCAAEQAPALPSPGPSHPGERVTYMAAGARGGGDGRAAAAAAGEGEGRGERASGGRESLAGGRRAKA